jgi:hypothetical protein
MNDLDQLLLSKNEELMGGGGGGIGGVSLISMLMFQMTSRITKVLLV